MGSGMKKEEKNEKLIRALSKLNENKKCINCNALVPQYVCTNFWTFVCLTCSGIHREFTHRVKSISMSKFTAAEVTALHSGGNERAREIYLKNWDFQRNSLPDSSNVERLRAFIKHVYVDRRYAAEGLPPRNRTGDYGRFSVDRRYPEDILDTGHFSLSSNRGNSAGDMIRRLSNYRGNNGETDFNGRLSNYRGNNETDAVKRSFGYSENDDFESIRRPSNYCENEGADGMRRSSNYSANGDINDTRRLSNYRGSSDEDSTGRLSYYRGNSDGDGTGCLSVYRGNSDGDSTGRLSNYHGNEDGDGLRQLSNYCGNDEGDIVRHLSIYHGHNEGDTARRVSNCKGTYEDNNEDPNQRREARVSNYQGNCPAQNNSPQHAGRGTLSHGHQKAESRGLPSGQAKNIHVANFASFGNGASVSQNFTAFKRANSDSLIDFGTHGSIPDKGTQSDIFGIQASHSVNEGWATFDVHSPSPEEVGSSGGNLIFMVGTSEKQTSEGEAPVQPTFDAFHSTTQFGNASLSREPLSALALSQEIAQQWVPFPSTTSLFEGSQHQSGSSWMPYNIPMTATSDSDQKQQEKASCSSLIQRPKSKNPFDLPEDYVPSSIGSINAQFPSMATLHTALPALGCFPSTILSRSNSTSDTLSSDRSPTGIIAYQTVSGSPAADYFGHTPVTSFALQTASLGASLGNFNSFSCTSCVGSATSTNLGLQIPVQRTSQPFPSNNPFD